MTVSDDVKTDGSMKFGALTDSFAWHLFSRAPENGGLPENVVVKNYDRCADGYNALMKGEIDVFVTEDYFARCMASNGLDLKTLYHNYIDEEYKIKDTHELLNYHELLNVDLNKKMTLHLTKQLSLNQVLNDKLLN